MNIVIRPGSLLYFSGGIFMSKLLIVLFFIGGPMALTQLIYRLVDHKGNKTRKLTDKFPVLKEKKFIIQMALPIAFIVLVGVISMIFHIPVKISLIIIGIFVGLINGMAITIMYNE